MRLGIVKMKALGKEVDAIMSDPQKTEAFWKKVSKDYWGPSSSVGAVAEKKAA